MSHEVAETDQNLREIERLRAELAATRADLDTLRNGVAWLGSELDRVKAWAGLWKKNANESDTRGLGPSFAKTALAFMQAMKEQGIRARRGSDPIQPQQAGGIYAAE
jgi:uncharacterized small protein (DUF1192 family)